jgi:hypothetical protein
VGRLNLVPKALGLKRPAHRGDLHVFGQIALICRFAVRRDDSWLKRGQQLGDLWCLCEVVAKDTFED